MKISKKWLQDFVFLPDSLSPEELGKELTLRTVEVEGIEKQDAKLQNIVVGQIKSIEAHPNADKLRVCQVDAGDETVQIVCGGSNLEVNMKVALAKIGASVLWHGEGEPVVMEKASLRGVDSYGMICGADEIGLSGIFPAKGEKEIVDLSHLDVKPGTPLAKALGLDDVTLEVDNKSLSNRPDLWGHIGMAREIATIYHKKLTLNEPAFIKSEGNTPLTVEVQDSTLCPRYTAVVVSGIQIAPSPEWMQKRLEACGLRPINNIVDITNYVMLELGQPCHAFDVQKLISTDIVVRHAKNDEKFVTLDEVEHTLSSDMLMICDKEKSLALAGIMGGMHSGISQSTTSILFESATFDAASIRKTSTRLGLRTDSSARFEKSLDPNNAQLGLRRLVELTLQICPGAKVVSEVVDQYPVPAEVKTIESSFAFFESRIGVSLEAKKLVDILERLGFSVEVKKGNLKITVPSWRATKDISLPEDIVEEIVRIWGYENIPSTLPTFSIVPPRKNSVKILERKIKEILSLESAYTETYNYSFESPEWLKHMGVDTSLHLELENPIAKDRPFIRRSLLANLLENVENNLHRFDEVKLFETGRVYKIEEAGDGADSSRNSLLPRQDTYLGFAYAKKQNISPFYELSSIISTLFDRLHLSFELRKPASQNFEHRVWVHSGRFAEIVVQDVVIGFLCELHPQSAKNMGIDERVALSEINLNLLSENLDEKIVYTALSLYPEVARDIAFVVDKNVLHGDIVKTIENIDPLIKSIEVFDVYEGDRIDASKKSMAYHIMYADSTKTLTTEEVDIVHKKVVDALNLKFGAEIRK